MIETDYIQARCMADPAHWDNAVLYKVPSRDIDPIEYLKAKGWVQYTDEHGPLGLACPECAKKAIT